MNKLALLSVSDKSGLIEFAESLVRLEYKIIATGNTAKVLSSKGINVTEVSNFTGFPEIFDGRVKTVHPKILGGILFRRDNDSDKKEADENDIAPINIVCVNLYPFVKTVENPDSDLDTIIENIDIGGPTLVRAAAKNYKYVSILTKPSQYSGIIAELKNGEITLETRKKLAVEAFSHTAFYDTYISNFLEEEFSYPANTFKINLAKEKELRYGENPHQKAALYGNFHSYFDVFHGKELSYNNIMDLIAAVELIEDLSASEVEANSNVCAIIKHMNPAGAAIGKSSIEAYQRALKCDPVSAFGGIVAFTSVVDEQVAEQLNDIFLEIICAPDYTDGAVGILSKKKNRRLLKQLKSLGDSKLNFKSIPGGAIIQDADNVSLNKSILKTVTNRKPSESQLEDLFFAWIVAKHTKSNSIVFVKDKATLGVGAGQMSRLDSAKIAAMKAKEYGLDLIDSVAASDAFFPFPDTLLEIIKSGAISIIQPGGSVKDNEVIDAANQNNISMVFTGLRHFKH